jgi:hypothetical protein
METLGDVLVTKTRIKTSKLFKCEYCDYTCSKKYNLERHLTSSKHSKTTIGEQNDEQNEQNEEQHPTNKNKLNNDKFLCQICNKIYDSRNGLWKHKKKGCNKTCEQEIETNKITNQLKCDYDITDKELILMLVKQNAELVKETTDFKSMMMEVIKNGTHNTNTINNTNSHNKAFNLNLFLNETCKDAMNINDFVESIKLQVSDLENVGEVGFVEGISNIIVKNLNALDITKRPIHCTDKKRETIYIKDENTWEKDESQCKMRKMIKKVVSKNQRLIPKFKEQNPEYNKSYSKVSDKYNKLIIESMGGSGDNDLEKEDKIIRNITKNIVVDKSV